MDASSRANATLLKMSNITDEGVIDVKKTACELLLSRRMELKMQNNKKLGDVMNRLSVAAPRPRDGRPREASIPPSVLAARAEKQALEATKAAIMNKVQMLEDNNDDMDERTTGMYGETGSAPIIKKWLERDREKAGGGAGVYRTDLTRYYSLADENWKSDMIPEIMDGKNVADFVDPEIEKRLAELEEEEDAMLAEEGLFFYLFSCCFQLFKTIFCLFLILFFPYS
jgi:nucleolar GTP-binding protein